jgi:hypothetical protein
LKCTQDVCRIHLNNRVNFSPNTKKKKKKCEGVASTIATIVTGKTPIML